MKDRIGALVCILLSFAGMALPGVPLTFALGPDDTVTYAQALTMIVRTMGLEENAVMAGGYPDGYIKVAVENGLAGEFSADQNELLTRWQVAEIVFGVFQ